MFSFTGVLLGVALLALYYFVENVTYDADYLRLSLYQVISMLRDCISSPYSKLIVVQI